MKNNMLVYSALVLALVGAAIGSAALVESLIVRRQMNDLLLLTEKMVNQEDLGQVRKETSRNTADLTRLGQQINSSVTSYRQLADYGDTELRGSRELVRASATQAAAAKTAPEPEPTPAATPAAPTPEATAATPAAPAPAAGETYIVKAGDTLAGIAKDHGTSVTAIQKANPKINPQTLQIGQKIRIP